ncbi:hypothetical protein C0992_001431 [Termitomyces sp. T32_za158]|nr:hypothetical protein C0992_001431 [Termitomyces sp. T32_za158]
MSFQAATAKLDAPVRDLVVAFTANGTRHVGEAEKDQKEVAEWIDRAAQPDVAGEASIQVSSLSFSHTPKLRPSVDTQRGARPAYVPRQQHTERRRRRDLRRPASLLSTQSKLQPQQYYATPALTRFFDHVQSLPPVRAAAAAGAFAHVVVDVEGAPALERKAEPVKKKEKKPATPVSALPASDAGAAPAPSASAPASKPPKTEKKEKKKKEESGKKAAANAPAADDGEPVPSMIDLRIGRIVDIKKHPDADSLYVEVRARYPPLFLHPADCRVQQIDFAEETGPRTVVSGLVNYIPIEQMRDKLLVGVCNLKPANMRGVKSFAMVLCATSKEGKEGGIELVRPPEGAQPGDRVYFEGADFENAQPLTQLNPKKKIFETIQPGFTTLETREAAWVNPATKSVHKIRTKDGFCIAPTFVGASLS